MSGEPRQYSRRSFLGLLGKGIVATTALSTLEAVVAPLAAQTKDAQQDTIPKQGTKLDLNKLFTERVYDDRFNSLIDADENVAKELYRYSLADLVSKGNISSKDTAFRDLWLPLGIDDEKKRMDFYKGMGLCWDDKIKRNSSRIDERQRQILTTEKIESLSKVKNGQKYSLREFRRNEVGHSIDVLKGLVDSYLKNHYIADSVYSREMKRLFGFVKDRLSANVLIGYQIQEMTPPALNVFTGCNDKGEARYENKKINAVSKAYYIDRLLKEGGKAVVERFPARYDIYLSYGPFQLTKSAMASIQEDNLNQYVAESDRVPTDMKDLRSLQDHVNASVMFAFYNWKLLGNHLAKNNLLKKFNNGFERLDDKRQQIVLAGITSCMHHLPAQTKTRVGYYVDQRSMDNMHYGIYESLGAQLDKYYKSAAEAYLTMKVFHTLDDTYGKKD